MSETAPKLTPSGLAALLCGRICHDLVSPIAALTTALEVLDDEDNPDMHGDAIELVKMSSKQASSKLQFLRLAFGSGGSAPGVMGVEMLKGLVEGLYGGGKVEIQWDNRVEGVSKSIARLLLNMTMIAVQAIPRGGRLNIRLEEKGGATLLTYDAEGPKARLAETVSLTLAGKAPADGFDGRSIQPFYTGMIARELKGRVEGKIEGERVTFTASLPNAPVQQTA